MLNRVRRPEEGERRIAELRLRNHAAVVESARGKLKDTRGKGTVGAT